MTTTADLIIVGAGLAGSAAAWVASARGLDVVLLEAFGPGHRNGSSHGSARIFRRAYLDPLYVRLTGSAQQRWRQLEDEAGERLLTLTGGLDFGATRAPAELHEVLTGCGVPAELLAPAAAAQRWPYFDFTGIGPVMYHADAGVLDPEHAVAAMLRLAAASGADIRFGTPVTQVETTPGGDGAVAHTSSGSYTAPVVVVAAGAWLAPLLDGVVPLPPLTVTQQQVFHFAPGRVSAEPWPVFIYQDHEEDIYGLPGGRDGGVPGAVKIGEHTSWGTPTTALTRDFTVDPVGRARVAALAQQRIPGLIPVPVNEVTCLYTRTANEDFVLDRHGPFVVASPCSGHGAKFAPLLGEIIADLAAGKPSPDARFTLAGHAAAQT
jgi:sarcosine oxidase